MSPPHRRAYTSLSKPCPNKTFPHQQVFFPIKSVAKSSTARKSCRKIEDFCKRFCSHKNRPNDLIVLHSLSIFFFFFSKKNPVCRDRTSVPTCQKVTRLPLSYRGDQHTFLKKNQNTPRPSEHPPVIGGEMSKRLGGIKGCKYKTSSWHFNRFPDADNIILLQSQASLTL